MPLRHGTAFLTPPLREAQLAFPYVFPACCTQGVLHSCVLFKDRIKLRWFFRRWKMKSFLLADIGNTSIKLAFGNEHGLGQAYSLPTRVQHTADSLGLSLLQILAAEGLSTDLLLGCAVCSVVPDVSSLFARACARYLRQPALHFPADLPPNLKNGYSQPHEVGADRLLAACAARTLFPGPASIISVDYGTATTFDCVVGDTYLGGLICPGLFSSRNALAANTAKLPRISLDVSCTEAVIGRDTETSMSHGFLFGFASLTEGLCRRLARQLPPPVFVVGTGGDALSLSKICGAFDAVRPDLLLEGLLMLCLGSRDGSFAAYSFTRDRPGISKEFSS